MPKFITNKEELLEEHLKKILPSTKQLDALVGFFYFSGFQNLYKDFQDKQIRVLIWMDVEKNIKNIAQEVFKLQDEKLSPKQLREQFFSNLKDVFNNTDIFDNQETQKALQVFIQKIIDWTLQIKKTKEPNHSKLYLFHYYDKYTQQGELPGALITGSSNFTYSGLQWRYELNVRFDDKEVFEKGLAIFNELWEDAIDITTWGEQDPLVQLLKNETWLKLWQPYALYIKLLQKYFEVYLPNIKTPSYLTEWKFKDLKYQIDALKQALNIVKQYNGVIIADVVGLGKSILASALIANLDQPAIVVSPPHLISQWEEYWYYFKLNLKVFSTWKLDEALNFANTHKHFKILLVDEAHRFRNDDTLSYWLLHQIAQGRKVILLTATPFNNAPADIFNLIKLFQIPKKSTLLEGNLQMQFSKLQKQYEELRKQARKGQDVSKQLHNLSQQVKNLIWPVVIRRSRIDLKTVKAYYQDLQKEGVQFPQVNPPQTIEFDLKNLEKKYIQTIQILLWQKIDWESLEYVRYSPLLYLKNWEKYFDKFDKFFGYSWWLIKERQKNMHLFITRQVVGRFESSLQSFKITLSKIISSYENYLKWIEKFNAVPIIRKGLMPDVEELEIDHFVEIPPREKAEQVLAEKYNGFLIDLEDLPEDFVSKIKKDLKILKKIQLMWQDVIQDPKLESLEQSLVKFLSENPRRKIVIFSQYADTVNYLAEKLKWKFKVLKFTGSIKTKELAEAVKKNFDASLPEKEWRDDYDILIATDAISEWYNLHRAWIVINYDIPYNPTVIIQRVGRINRIWKKVFDKIYIYNYFPSFKWEQIVRHRQIAKLKLDMIGLILWIDTKILDESDPLGSFYTQQIQENEFWENEQSWDAPYLDEYLQIKNFYPEYLKEIEKMPARVRVKRNLKDDVKLVAFFQKWKQFDFYALDKEENLVKLDLPHWFAIFKASMQEKWKPVSANYYSLYTKLIEQIKNKPAQLQKISSQTKKVINLIQKYQQFFGKDYAKLLLEVIKDLWALPQVYLSQLRELDGKRLEVVEILIKEFKQQVTQQYLQSLIKQAKNFDLQNMDLIMVEEGE